jgi:hypothetical protein
VKIAPPEDMMLLDIARAQQDTNATASMETVIL